MIHHVPLKPNVLLNTNIIQQISVRRKIITEISDSEIDGWSQAYSLYSTHNDPSQNLHAYFVGGSGWVEVI